MSGLVATCLPERDRQAEGSQVEARRAELWACLRGVTDPELDESVVDLNFVTRADVDAANHVHIEFRLPTYWCAANFSFLMADDMRRAATALDWVESVSVVLGEHMYADKINAGLAQGLSFQETFGVEADGNLDDLRRTFLVKAFQRRQVALLNHLTATGHSPETITAFTLAELRRLPVDDDGDGLRRRYLERRDVVAATGDDMPAFVDAAGCPLRADGFSAYVSGLRRVGINAEFNSALCRGLLSVRFDLDTPFVPKARASA
ncbi:metal-sulfur cluster assembly factor [Bradyrhizobium oligotrophicum]|uniref:metal-sulfur cluster assembly factor n=1 Tax=Bradyrhizobium oligotrophicum TaxID=44255 RepID=UPI003EB75544